MKIVAEIPDPHFKITIFRSGFKHIVKFDDSMVDFAFKFHDGEINSLDDLIHLVKERLQPQAIAMRDTLQGLRARSFDGRTGHDPEFPRII